MKLTTEQIEALNRPLPPEAIAPHPSKTFLSTIKPVYVIERLNEVFGPGGWCTEYDVIESPQDKKMVVVRLTFTVDEYGIRLQQFGGNDNVDRGDAYKGASTDALTKIASLLGIGADVWKNGKGEHHTAPAPAAVYEDEKVIKGRYRLRQLLEQCPADDETLARFEAEIAASANIAMQTNIAARINELIPSPDPRVQNKEHAKRQPA
jgi:hypothetical protein